MGFSPARRSAFALAVLAAGAVWLAAPGEVDAAASAVTVETKPILRFQPGSEETRFGALEFVGGFEFWSSDGRIESVSAIRLTDGGSRLLAVTDNGDWLTAEIGRDDDGRPGGVRNALVAPLLGTDGEPLDGKVDADAEALSIAGGRVLVGFERNHRILAYSAPEAPFDSRPERLELPIPRHELRINRGIETIATSPAKSPLGGASIALAEHSIDTAGNLFAAIISGSRNGVFKVRRDEAWSATDGAFLPDGDLLVLERRYSGPFSGLGMRIRRIPGDTIEPGALVDGPVIFEADLAQEIDNMEGLDVWTDASGETRLTLVSDDNGSLFQRSLLLEFRLLDAAPPAGAIPSN